jgi:transposase
MQVLYERCAGLDIHKDSVVACVLVEGRAPVVERFGTTSEQILALGDWLVAQGVTHAAMESTGVYWKPIWNLLEERVALMLVNAQHIKQVPGRKTDVLDCQWIAQLLRHGLLRPSFVPDRPLRELRDLTRQRAQLVADRARVANRIQKVLEDANIKLGSVAADILGKSARAMLEALVGMEEVDAATVAELALGRMRSKIPQLTAALRGTVNDHHRFMLRQALDQVGHLEQQIAAFDARIAREMSQGPFAQALPRLDKIPGINTRAAQSILAEIGADMGRFSSAQRLCSWAGVCPGNNESAGRRRSGRVRAGNRWLKPMLAQCAWAASRTQRSYYHDFYRRVAGRRGHKRAILAVAHSQLATIWHLLSRQSEYVDLGPEHLKHHDEHRSTQDLVRRLQRLGYAVTLSPAA